MKKFFITLILLFVLFVVAVLFARTDALGWPVNPWAAFGMAIGLMVGSYVLAMLAVFLLRKLEGKDAQRLLIAIFLVLYALFWKMNLAQQATEQCYMVLESAVMEMQETNLTQGE